MPVLILKPLRERGQAPVVREREQRGHDRQCHHGVGVSQVQLEHEQRRAFARAAVAERLGGGLPYWRLVVVEQVSGEQAEVRVAEARERDHAARAYAHGAVGRRAPACLGLDVARAQQERSFVLALEKIERLEQRELGVAAGIALHGLDQKAGERGAERCSPCEATCCRSTPGQ